jgi:hypothetical protein
MATVLDHQPVAPSGLTHRSPARRLLLPGATIGAAVVTVLALSAAGDTPDPHDPPASMSAYFVAHRGDIIAAAPLAYVGVLLLLAATFGWARRLHRYGDPTSGVVVAATGTAVAGYLVALQVVFTSLAYQVAASDPAGHTTKALFVPTILAVPAFAAATAALLGAAAVGAVRTGLFPRWWAVLSGVGAAVASVGVVGFAESGYLYPDVQQQWAAQVLTLWLLVTGVTAGVRELRR